MEQTKRPSLPAPGVLDAFVDSAIEVLPDQQPSRSNCATLGESWRARGLRAGDLVLLCLPNSAELLHQFFGVLVAGGVPALLSPMTPAGRLHDIAQTMGARAIVGFRLPMGDLGLCTRSVDGRLQVAMFAPTPVAAAAPGELVLLTSGTSGLASGCVFDVEAVLLNASRHADAIGQRADDVVLVNLPLHFSYALVAQALAALMRGSRFVIGGPPFSLTAYRKVMKDHAVTLSSLTPVLVRSILSNDPSVLAPLRVLTIGGDSLEPALVAQTLAARSGGELYLTYGLTQAGPRVSTLAVHREPSSRYSSVGLPLAGTRVSLLPVDDGSVRQLHVTSDTVMKRTIGRVEGRSTHDSLTHGPSSRTIATGDACHQDDDGYLYVRGRLGDFISRRGEKINLAAVRRVARQLKGVVTARTPIVSVQGSEDFDLELGVDKARGESVADVRSQLRRMLGQSEMPREIHVQVAARAEPHYK